MQALLLKMLLKFMTEQFIGKVVVLGAKELAKSTTNQLDDQLVDAVAVALGVPEAVGKVVDR
jgi:hypothetical protein